MSMKGDIVRRIIVIYFFVVLFSAYIMGRAFWVQTVERDKWTKMALPASQPRPVELEPNRGDICAADGRILASSIPYYELRFDASVVDKEMFRESVDSLALCLSSFFRDYSKSYYKKMLTEARYKKPRPNRYLLINRRKVSHTELQKIKEFPIFRWGKNKGGLIGIMNSVRVQPHVNLASRTIGYLSDSEDGSFEGRVGLEGAFENELRGKPGVGIKRMMSGRLIVVPEKNPVDGNDVITTIDVDYQDIAQHALLRQLQFYGAENGTAILMEVKTGDVKAIANLTRTADGGYKENLNYAIGDAAEPGSVFKAATMIALLEDGYVEPYDTIDLGTTGVYKFYDRKLAESDNKGLGRVTVKRIMEKSSNGIAKLVFEHYKGKPEKFINRMIALGLNKPLGIRIKGEGLPHVKHPKDKDWSGITLPWMSIGYEVKMTPLQVLAFYNAIANDGYRVKPRFVKEIREHGNVVETFDTEEEGDRICSKQTLKKLKDMLEGVVETGTAKNINTDNYKIAGKTGTAWIADGSKGYTVRKYKASFVGYFPAEKPLYSCIVVINNPKFGFYAGVVSATVFREISDKVYSVAYRQHAEPEYNTEKSLPVSKNGLKADFKTIFDELDFDVEGMSDAKGYDWVITSRKEAESMVVKPRSVNFATVPNVKGMGLRDALYVLENTGLKVGVSGSGMVQEQSILPGADVPGGTYIRIELR